MIVTSRSTVSIRNDWYGRALPIQRKKKRITSDTGSSDTPNSKSRRLSASHPKPICTISHAEGVQTYHMAWQGLTGNPEELIIDNDKKDCEFIPKYITETKHQVTLKQDVSQSCITNPTSKQSLHPFECRYCGRITDSIDRFRRHTQRHRFWRRKPYRCSICATVFSFESELTCHQGKVHVMTTDTGKNTTSASEEEINVDLLSTNHESYQCLLCDKTFKDRTELTKHRATHEVLTLSGADTEKYTFGGDRQWEYPQCSKTFQEQNKFAEHLLMSHNKRVLEIKSKVVVQSDVPINRPINLFKCPKCMLYFRDKSNLSKHLLNHPLKMRTLYSDKIVNEKHKCPCCEKTFDHEFELTAHVVTHGENDSLAVISTDAPILERPNQCPVCKKTFKGRVHMNIHLRVHTGEKPYLCDHCPKRFANKSNLTSHLRSTHIHDKRYECPICQKSFSGSSGLKKHIRIHTLEKTYQCKECPKIFATKSNLSQHTQIHTQEKKHVCQVCGKRFIQKSSLTQHAWTHTLEKPYRTELTKHGATHEVLTLSGADTEKKTLDGDRQWKCPQCSKTFQEQNKFAEHLSMSHNKRVLEIKSKVIVQSDVQKILFKCPKCMLYFRDKSNLSKHLLNHPLKMRTLYSDKIVNEKHKCPCCEKTFDHENELTAHVVTHTNNEARFREDLQKCQRCKQVFTDRRYLIEHLKTHWENDSSAVIGTDAPVSERPNQCPVCKKTIKNKGPIHMNNHLRTHTGEKPYLCDHCPKRFATKGNLTSHLRSTHIHDKRYECPICQKGFSGSSDLKKHIRIHTLEKPFQCKECQKSFARKSNLSQHTRIHTQEKKHLCEVCGKSFIDKSSLIQHARTHTLEKPYQCNRCEKSFASKSSLNQHFDTHQKLEKIHQCQHCNKSFIVKRYLIRHMRTTHKLEKPYQCQYCSDSFSHNCELTAHMQSHALVKRFGCPQCSKTFIEVQDLLDHSRIHMIGKPYLPETAAKLNETEATLKTSDPDRPSTSLLEAKKAKEFTANPKILHMMGTSERPRYYHEKIESLQNATRLNETEAALKAARAQKSKLELNQTSVINPNKKDVLVRGYRCDHCQKHFPNQVKLKEHKKVLRLDTPYQ